MSKVIVQAYLNAGQEVPSLINCQSTCTMATSWAALREFSLADINYANFNSLQQIRYYFFSRRVENGEIRSVD